MIKNNDAGAPMSGTPILHEPPKGLMKEEPEVTIGIIVAAVSAVIGILVASGITVDPGLRDAILTGIGPIFILVSVLWVRLKTYSPRSAQKQMNIAAATGDATITPPPAKDTDTFVIANGRLVDVG